MVLSVDEKPSIQALERAQGYLKLPNGRAMTGQSHNYKRHGTTTLSLPWRSPRAEVVGRHYRRRRRIAVCTILWGIGLSLINLIGAGAGWACTARSDYLIVASRRPSPRRQPPRAV